MSSSKTSVQPNSNRSAGFWLLAVATIGATAGLCVAAKPYAMAAAQAESRRLTQIGEQAGGAEAQLSFELAHMLSRHNQPAALDLAREQVAAGQYVAALDSLAWAGQGSEAAKLRLIAQLELGHTTAATVSAAQLSATAPTDDNLLLATLADTVTGQAAPAQALADRVSAPEARSRAVAALANPLTLGRELAASGLLNTAERILTRQPVSAPRELLLGDILSRRPTPERLALARRHYEAAIRLNPADPAARQALITTLTALGDTAAANQQMQQLKRL